MFVARSLGGVQEKRQIWETHFLNTFLTYMIIINSSRSSEFQTYTIFTNYPRILGEIYSNVTHIYVQTKCQTTIPQTY